MGERMCGHIATKGYKTTIFNRTKSKTDDLVSKGCKLASSVLEVAQNSDVVFTILSYPDDVRQVILGVDGVVQGLSSGGIVVDMTTSSPSLAKEISEACV